MLPDKEEFPYTIRIVADMLESDGSTSMATVCGSTMALMNAGVPIKKMVSGIAMGLLRSAEGKFQAISDITGIEDAFGLMDFKVAGTDKVLLQFKWISNIKVDYHVTVFEAALSASKQGRNHILDRNAKGYV